MSTVATDQAVESRFEISLELIRAIPGQFRRGFDEWLAKNWELYLSFEQQARNAGERRAHYSAYTVVEYLRHETLLRDAESDFKLNQAWTSSVARLFAHLNPIYSTLFEFREREGGVVDKFKPL